ncbi:WSC-domain-containing protein [Mollisia scopiformis]|uniref:WSC-domain-containing protein n=1 Tax=Mollisia scopiformis TaxID=149040 RepID=A0A132B8B4_MOLSC|nr:WSC-domain-containing protein [Mollisia scopiformis]KUJ08648.1 WSC-domain-containing protein [Mollisia scopiformis]
MTVEICTAFSKGNDYQYAGLEYYGECFCGASVNGPQVNESFCSDPCAGDTSEICGGTDYVSVYQDPTYPVENNSTISDYKPLGCYTDLTDTGRTLPWQQSQLNASSMTVESCLFACKDGGYAFAGVEFGQQCFCGVVLGNSTSKVDLSECNTPCTGNSSESCGDAALLNLYVAADIESTEPCTGGTPPPSSTTSSTPTPTLCTSTVTVSSTPKYEYNCGEWCSTPIPPFTNPELCTSAVGACTVQVASCFLNAGFPASLRCFEFGAWCDKISTYCSSFCPGNSCSALSCKSKYPPQGYQSPTPTISTSVFTCSPTSKTTSTSSTTSCVPVPTTGNVCKQPNSPTKGYTSSSPVGNIPLPVLTCNNLYSDYVQHPFKLYTSSDTTQCKSYIPGSSGSSSVCQGCKDACDSQYSSCTTTYAQSCKGNSGSGGQDTYSSATTKCTDQWTDCYAANSGVSGSGRCGSWNSGWSK